MKRIILLLALVFCTGIYSQQRFAGGSLDGPMTTTEINALVSPTEGLEIYNSTTQTKWRYNGASWDDLGSGGSGDVTAASNFGADNVLVRSDGTGKGVQSTGISVDDSDNVNFAGELSMANNAISGIGSIQVNGVSASNIDLVNFTDKATFLVSNPRISNSNSQVGVELQYNDGTQKIAELYVDSATGDLYYDADTGASSPMQLNAVGTPDDDSVTPAKLADGDFGDWSVSTNVATLDNDVVAAAEMADADHGDISWSGGVASIDPNTVTSTIISNETILSEDIATDAVTGSEILNGTIEEPDLEATNAPTDNQILSFDSASNGFTWVNDDTGGSSLPVADGTSIAEGSADATKEVRFEVDGLTTATTRVITMPDKDVDLDDFVDVTISGRTGTPVTAIMEQTQAQYDVDGDPPAGTVVVISDAASADSFTGTAIPLDGYYQRDDTTTDTATWTLGTSRNGGSAEILINLATEPTVTGSTVITGSEAFQANTLSVLTVKNFSGTVKHWFTSL